jgi:hypothetical protein
VAFQGLIKPLLSPPQGLMVAQVEVQGVSWFRGSQGVVMTGIGTCASHWDTITR